MEEKEIMDRWREYSKDLLNEQNKFQLERTGKMEGTLEITKMEVEAALRETTTRKAAGPTEVTSIPKIEVELFQHFN